MTEGLTWATTGLVVGFSASTWLAGRLVDSAGVPWAFSVATVSGALALLLVPGGLPAAAGHLTVDGRRSPGEKSTIAPRQAGRACAAAPRSRP